MIKGLKSRAIALGVLAAGTLLSGCGPLISFGGDGPADTVYSLRYSGAYQQKGADSIVIYVDEPLMAEGLAGQKITVALPSDKRSTLKGARWSAPLSVLIRDYEIRAFGHQVGANMIGEGGLDIHAACRLGTKVWAFEFTPGADAGTDKVDIAIELSLVRLSDSQLLSHPIFTKTRLLNSGSDDAVANAFGAAMGELASEMSVWLKSNEAACAGA